MTPFIRTELALGSDACERLARSHVTICGLGAVGSMATEALVRSGIGAVRLIDFDVVNASNINRQLYALHSTIGRLKTELAAERCHDIHPDCRIDTQPICIDRAHLPEVLAPPTDCVVDAIDSLGAKVELLQGAVTAGLPIVSSMGAATRTEPSEVAVGDLFQTEFCPLARFVRKRLRRRGITGGIRCVYSREQAATHEAEERARRLGLEPEPVREGVPPRVPLGSFICITGIFGLMLAREVIRILLCDVHPTQPKREPPCHG